ncbi:MAG: hypothetical protein ABI718_01605 [Acidobacteriota bacterium]
MKSLLAPVLVMMLATSLSAAVTHPANLVVPLTFSAKIVIPAAASKSGANGTFFRSDITVLNFADHMQRVQFRWLPQGGGAGSTTTLDMQTFNGLRSGDFVAEVLNQSGLGSILVTAVTNDGLEDPNGRLYAASRIWTPQAGTTGTTSQSFPSVPFTSIDSPAATIFAMGAADDPDRYRVNVGIVNLDPVNTQQFQIAIPTVLGPSPTVDVSIPPMSMQQVAFGNGVSPTSQFSIVNNSPAGSRSNAWIAYGSTVDNVTGDAWSELAVTGNDLARPAAGQ